LINSSGGTPSDHLVYIILLWDKKYYSRVGTAPYVLRVSYLLKGEFSEETIREMIDSLLIDIKTTFNVNVSSGNDVFREIKDKYGR
jgi:hypothetical protein